MKLNRHGDVLLVKIDSIPKGAKPLEDKVLAYGEITGHTHRFVNADIERYEYEGVKYLQVFNPTPLIHEEHKYQIIEPGMYRQEQENEWDYIENARKLAVD